MKRQLSPEAASCFGLLAATGLIFVALPAVMTAHLSGLSGEPLAWIAVMLDVIEPLRHPILAWLFSGFLLSLVSAGRKVREILWATFVLSVGIWLLCGLACWEDAQQHRFWVAELVDTHQKIAIFFGNGEIVVGKELGLDGRFQPHRGRAVCPNPARDLGVRVL